jgi:uncharacterized protein (DUF2062 family)
MMRFLKRRLVDPLLALLRQGVAPDRLALCVAIGVTVGCIPILGVSTILCTVIALSFRLNLAAMQLVQALMAPIQLLLIVPFVRLGEWLLRAAPQPVSIHAGMELLKQGVWHTVLVLKDAIIHAGIAWILVAPLAIFLLYRILKPIFQRTAAALPRAPAAAYVTPVTLPTSEP